MPNLLLLHSHDTGRWIEPYDARFSSPALADFAREATVFRNAYTVNPTCSPSRCAMLTGQFAHSCGMFGLAHRGFSMPDYSRHLSHLMACEGYETVLAGIQHETEQIENLGYEKTLAASQRESRDSNVVTEAAVSYLKSPKNRPFFLSVGFWQTHRKFADSAAAPTFSGELPEKWPDRPEIRRDLADFQASLTLLDQGIGKIFCALRASGLWDDTMIICTTDHGPAFPGMKCTMYEEGLGVMLMIKPPKGAAILPMVDDPVTQLDVLPTVFEMLGIQPPAKLDGKSLCSLIRGGGGPLHDAIFSETNFHACYEPQRCVQMDGWKYIRRYGRGPVLGNIDDGPTKTALYRAGALHAPNTGEELYFLRDDPDEQINLALAPGFDGVLTVLRARVNRWMRESGDPLLRGDLPKPSGALVTPRNAYSASGEKSPEETRMFEMSLFQIL